MAAAGTHLGHSDWHEITQEQVNLFADATGDHQWIHVDPQRAAQGPFGTTIAHGYLTLSLVPLFVSEVYTVEGVRMAVNYGCNKVRFPAPVPVGSRLRAGVSLDSVTPGADGLHRRGDGDRRGGGRRQARVRRRDAGGRRPVS